jgi:hypothetical protein
MAFSYSLLSRGWDTVHAANNDFVAAHVAILKKQIHFGSTDLHLTSPHLVALHHRRQQLHRGGGGGLGGVAQLRNPHALGVWVLRRSSSVLIPAYISTNTKKNMIRAGE